MKRTNIVLDEKLVAEAMRLSGLTTTKQIVHLALKTFIQRAKRQSILKLRGKVDWDGDLSVWRD
ncbi:MAG: type II toxin-antitoxin system VapB family antitoxin [Deltaproteobacteria bacterium]|nr:type II toxin-antitoxin system VapB family antitoxin [Deltaproteobacteria bacterium]